jgi:aspartokinase-like uncharacterized kinase
MWVVKIGGSLGADPLLPHWLELLAQLGGGRVTVVCGGGGFADEVRRMQAQWAFNDLAAHNMAVLAMAQSAYQWQALKPELQLATRQSDILRVLRKGRTAVWLPFELQRELPDAQTTWEATSDTIALNLARRLNAERLVMVKSCAIDTSRTLVQLGEDGVIDRQFAALSDGADFPIDIMHKAELSRMRALLLGDVRFLDR